MHEGDRLVVGPLGELVIHIAAEGDNR
jgi:N-methylhydantoinase A